MKEMQNSMTKKVIGGAAGLAGIGTYMMAQARALRTLDSALGKAPEISPYEYGSGASGGNKKAGGGKKRAA